jgi:hypothetical protein
VLADVLTENCLDQRVTATAGLPPRLRNDLYPGSVRRIAAPHREKLPAVTFGQPMKAADLDIATLHGWIYLGRELPEAATDKLEEFYRSAAEGGG